MVRNFDHRIEVACPVFEKSIQEELKEIIEIQLEDNVKARILDNDLSNEYVTEPGEKQIRSQIEIFNTLLQKIY